MLDVLGCGLAAHGLGVAGEGRATMAELGTGDATAIGLDTPLPAPHAAFANAMLCHGLDYDDTHSDSVCHITVVVVPAALAVAESLGRSGEDVLTAVTAGTEVVARIGMAASGAFHARGFHPTSVCGVFGATAAAARLAGLDVETTTSALGLAGSMSSGLMAYLNDGTPTKPVHAGWAAQAGVLAARLAAHGAAGPGGRARRTVRPLRRVRRRRRSPHSRSSSTTSAAAGRRSASRTSRTRRVTSCTAPSVRPSPCSTTWRSSEIDEVTVTVPETLVPVILEPEDAKLQPRTTYEGKFSLQYSTAAMLVHGRVDLTTYTDDVLHDPHVLELAQKVRYEGRGFETIRVPSPGRRASGRRTVARSRPSWPTSRARRRTR